MKKLLITLLLISPFSFAEWGDVYYCQMTSFVGTDADGKVEQYKLEKFQFKLDKSKQAAVFGDRGYFAGSTTRLADWTKHGTEETWRGENIYYSITMFDRGTFFMVNVNYGSIDSVSADCDKF